MLNTSETIKVHEMPWQCMFALLIEIITIAISVS